MFLTQGFVVIFMGVLSVKYVIDEYCECFLGFLDYSRRSERAKILDDIGWMRKHLLKLAATFHQTSIYDVTQNSEIMDTVKNVINDKLIENYGIRYDDFLLDDENKKTAQKILSISKNRNIAHRIALLQFIANNRGCTSSTIKKYFTKLSLATIQLCLIKYTRWNLIKRVREKRGEHFRYQILDKGLKRIQYLKDKLSSILKGQIESETSAHALPTSTFGQDQVSDFNLLILINICIMMTEIYGYCLPPKKANRLRQWLMNLVLVISLERLRRTNPFLYPYVMELAAPILLIYP